MNSAQITLRCGQTFRDAIATNCGRKSPLFLGPDQIPGYERNDSKNPRPDRHRAKPKNWATQEVRLHRSPHSSEPIKLHPAASPQIVEEKSPYFSALTRYLGMSEMIQSVRALIANVRSQRTGQSRKLSFLRGNRGEHSMTTHSSSGHQFPVSDLRDFYADLDHTHRASSSKRLKPDRDRLLRLVTAYLKAIEWVQSSPTR